MSQIKKIQLSNFLRKATFTLLLILGTFIVSFAQCPDPNNPDCPGGGDPGGGPGVPLDGGVALLIAGGIGYVALRMRKQHLKRKTAALFVEK
jgi:hypothetical protein